MLDDKQWARFEAALAADEDAQLSVNFAWGWAQRLRSAYRYPNLGDSRKIAETVVTSFHRCPLPEINCLGCTLKQRREAFLACSDTARASNGGTEAVNGLIELP